MYDLFALGQLMDESMSGYLMQSILQQIVGRQRKISFGMIYPLFNRLKEAGYITISEVKSKNNRFIKVATITDAGKERFYELMAQKVPLNPNLDFTYSVKFRNFHQVDLSLRRQILHDYQTYLLKSQELLTQQAQDLKNTKISKTDLKNARWVIELEQMKMKAALDWVKESIRQLNEGEN